MTNPASSELSRSAALFASLARAGKLRVGRTAVQAPLPPATRPAPVPTVPPLEPADREPSRQPPPLRETAALRDPTPPRERPSRPASGAYRSDQMGDILRNMCKRGGFSGAVVADRGGLPVADFNSPVELDVMAALGSVLGGSLEQAADLLQRPEANNLSVDINYVDKIVLRTFRFENLPYHLLVICPQAIDERSEVELSIEQIQGVLSHEM